MTTFDVVSTIPGQEDTGGPFETYAEAVKVADELMDEWDMGTGGSVEKFDRSWASPDNLYCGTVNGHEGPTVYLVKEPE